MWRLLVVQCGLRGHLTALKDYLLLARGDLYCCFLTDAAGLMGRATPPTSKEIS